MTLQYISDNTGQTTAVIIPISEWNAIRSRHPDVDDLDSDIPQWQKNIIDRRLQYMSDNPGMTIPLEDFTEELKKGLQDEY